MSPTAGRITDAMNNFFLPNGSAVDRDDDECDHG
jgi:hypothetical protein